MVLSQDTHLQVAAIQSCLRWTISHPGDVHHFPPPPHIPVPTLRVFILTRDPLRSVFSMLGNLLSHPLLFPLETGKQAYPLDTIFLRKQPVVSLSQMI